MEDVAARYARVHGGVHGDGRETVRRVLTTCGEMLRDRGYAEVWTDADALEAAARGEPVMRARGEPARRADVYLHREDRVGVKFVRAVLDATEADARVLIVSPDGPTPFTRKECDARVQFMHAAALCYNVTRHRLVPRHVVAEPPPGTRGCLPHILDTDPVVQYYDWPCGTVVRVERCWGGHEPVPYYRVVAKS